MARSRGRKTWRHRLWSWLDPPHKRVDKDILTFPAPAKIEGRRVTFVDGTTFEADVLVYATGYCQRFPFLEPVSCPPPAAGGAGEAGGWRGGSGARGEEDPLPSEHFIVSAEEPTLAFLGFVRPNVGAIPPMSELQVLWWIEKLRGRIAAGHAPPSYGLLGKKLVYGVDYGNYMHQLAAEFGAVPSLWSLARRPRVLVAYCLGQAYVSFFRLQGPFASQEAWEVAATELYAPVLRRGIATNLVFLAVMLVFGSMSAALCAAEAVLALPRAAVRLAAAVPRRLLAARRHRD